MVDEFIERLTAANHGIAVQLAAIPEESAATATSRSAT